MKKTKSLTINQRLIAVFIYLVIFLSICYYFSGNWDFLTNSNSKYNLLFISGALLLVFGTYIAEPYFTKPLDVLTNSIAVILALGGIRVPELFFGYWAIFYTSIVLIIFSIFSIFIFQVNFIKKFQKVFFEIITKIGQSKNIFSLIYLAALLSYFTDKPLQFAFFFTFWVVFITKYIVEGFIHWGNKLLVFILNNKNSSEIIGQAIGCENPFLYKIEVDYFKHRIGSTKKGQLVYLSLDKNEGAVGIIINEKYLLNKKWITIYLLEYENAPLRIDLKRQEFINGSKTIFSKDNAVYSLDFLDIKDSKSKSLVRENYLFKNKNNFIGYVAKGSDINKVLFHSLLDIKDEKYQSIKEGVVIKMAIHGSGVLYQIIDGYTDEEELEKHSRYGYMIGVAKKLGRYNASNGDLNIVKWLPNIYTPVFFNTNLESEENDLGIGHFPETNMDIRIKNIDSLITHNTAILGILGIGKSCLTFELIKKIVEKTNVKIICVDITNEYKRELCYYFDENIIVADDENIFNDINVKFEHIEENGSTKNHEKSGNKAEYRDCVKKDLMKFFFEIPIIPDNKEFLGEKRVRIFNPDYHKASKGEKIGFNVITTELSQAEKTRIISEEVFKIIMKLGLTSEGKAKVLIVFEEAHSLVPEWSSAANEGDKTAVNGTAKVILQGRKYGLGSFVITQRTANISKSILNQCNTIFSLRVFDDTGKKFLENYIGSDYANTLPTLEDRHAVVVGKALKLKQPIIIKLNNRDKFRIINPK